MHLFKYLQQRFPVGYRYYCRIRYPDPWGTFSNLDIYLKIIWRRLLHRCHVGHWNSEMKKMQSIKNSHTGERCFIVGTGASLTYDDLDKIKDEYSFSVNSIFLTYQKTSWRPNCYGIVDYLGYKEDISKYSNKDFNDYAKEFVFLHSKIKIIGKRDKLISILVNNANHQKYRMKKKLFKQEKELSICFYDCFTVTNMMIALAIYMGFKKIYLIGVDCDYSGEKMHIEETLADQIRKNDTSHLKPREDLMFYGYELMKKVAEEENCSIYNTTRGGKLEVFPKINLEEVIEG